MGTVAFGNSRLFFNNANWSKNYLPIRVGTKWYLIAHTNNALYMYKATGTTFLLDTWTEQDASNNPESGVTTNWAGGAFTIEYLAATVVGTTIHICFYSNFGPADYTSIEAHHITYDTSTETWGTFTNIFTGLNLAGAAGDRHYFLEALADGSLIYGGVRVQSVANMGTNYVRYGYHTRSAGGTWTTNIAGGSGAAKTEQQEHGVSAIKFFDEYNYIGVQAYFDTNYKQRYIHVTSALVETWPSTPNTIEANSLNNFALALTTEGTPSEVAVCVGDVYIWRTSLNPTASSDWAASYTTAPDNVGGVWSRVTMVRDLRTDTASLQQLKVLGHPTSGNFKLYAMNVDTTFAGWETGIDTGFPYNDFTATGTPYCSIIDEIAGTPYLVLVGRDESDATHSMRVSWFALSSSTTYDRTAAIAGASTVAANSTQTSNRAAAIAGVSSVAAVKNLIRYRTAAMAGASTLAVAAAVEKNRAAAIAGVSAFAATFTRTYAEAAAIASNSTVAATYTATRNRAAAVAGASALTVARTVTRPAAATIAGVSTVAATYGVTKNRSATVAGSSTVAALAEKTSYRTAAMASASTLAVTPSVTRDRSAAMVGASTLAAVGSITRNRTAAIMSTSSLTALNLDGFRWDSNTVVNATLTNNNLTASIGTNDAWAFVRETKTTGKFYFEMVLDTYTSGVSSAMLGVTTSDDTVDLGFYLSDTNYSVGLFGSNGTLGLNDANYSPSHGEHTQGDVICFAIDYDNQLLWWRRNNGDWWGSAAGAANPAAGTDGYDFSTITTTTEYWLATYIYEAQFTAHLTPGAMAYSAPSGFIAYSTTQTDRTAAIAGVSTLAVVGQRIVSRTAAVASASTLAVSAQITRDRAATIAGASTLAATKQVTRTRAAAVNAASTVTVSANVQRTAAAAIDGVSGVTAAAAVTRTRAASIAAATTFAAVGKTTKPRTATVAGVSTVTAVAQTTHRVSAMIGAVSSVAALAEVAGNFNRTAQIDAVSTVAAVAKKTSNRSATVSAVSTMVAAGSVNNEFPRSAQIDAASTVTVNREVIRGAAANINAATTVTASGQRIVTRAAAMAGASNVVALGQKRIDRAFAAAGASSMAALGVRMLLRNAVMTATSTVIATRTSNGTSKASASYTGVENGILLVVEYNKIEVQQDANGIVIGS